MDFNDASACVYKLCSEICQNIHKQCQSSTRLPEGSDNMSLFSAYACISEKKTTTRIQLGAISQAPLTSSADRRRRRTLYAQRQQERLDEDSCKCHAVERRFHYATAAHQRLAMASCCQRLRHPNAPDITAARYLSPQYRLPQN